MKKALLMPARIGLGYAAPSYHREVFETPGLAGFLREAEQTLRLQTLKNR